MTNNKRQTLFHILLFSSGLCGISYEILYSRILGNIIGDQFTVSASILLTFILGIGIGTLLAHKLWRHLWMLEAGIGLYGVLFAIGAPLLNTLLYTEAGSAVLGIGMVGALLVCVVFLLVPSFLIGTSLPVFAGYLGTMRKGRVFARAYAFYNFGAAATTLIIEFLLIRQFGIRNATLVIAMINALVSILLIQLFRNERESKPELDTATPYRFPANSIAALILASIASAIFQLLMVKIAECYIGPFRETFAFVLCLILLGIAIGSLITHYAKISFSTLITVNIAAIVWLLGAFSYVTTLYARYHPLAADSYTETVGLKLWTLAILMLVPATTFGGTIPALMAQKKDIARESGQLLFYSSIANAFGFLVMAFYLHQSFDYGILLLVIAGLSTIAIVLYKYRSTLVIFSSLLFVLAYFSHKYFWEENLLYLGYTAFLSEESLDEDRGSITFPEKFKGPQDVFSITWFEDRPYFFINGYISIPLDAPSEKIVGAFSAVYAPRADTALVLGIGSGATANTTAQMFEYTDAVEINGVVIENLFRMKKYNFDIERNPRINIIHDDAIHFTKISKKQYSLIINTVATPLYFSSSKLYTLDFFEDIKKRLAADGLYVTWIDTRVGDRGLDILMNTIKQSFNYCGIAYIKSTYFLLLCSQQPIHPIQPNIVASNKVLAPFLFQQFGIKATWLAYGLLRSDISNLIEDRTTPLNTLDYPALEFEMARLRKRGYKKFLNRLQESMSVEEIQACFTGYMPFQPAALLKHTEVMLEDSRFTSRWNELLRSDPAFADEYRDTEALYYDEYASLGSAADAYHQLGNCLKDNDKYDAAIIAYKKALNANPMHNDTNFNIGACYEYLNDYKNAVAYYRKELIVDARNPDVPYRVGRVFVKMGEFSKGIQQLQIAAQVSNRAAIFYYLGRAYEGLQQYEEAERYYREALHRDEEYSEARKNLEGIHQRQSMR